MEGEPQQLIETVAEALAYTILRQHPLVQFAIVRVDKPEAPIDGTFGTVGEIRELELYLCVSCIYLLWRLWYVTDTIANVMAAAVEVMRSREELQ